MTPGPRQTIDRARHPVLGEGIAVYRNGPAYFQPDGGEPVPMKSIDVGGVSTRPVKRTWLVAYTEAGERIELDTTDRQRGDRHFYCARTPHGPGWMVHVGNRVTQFPLYRFEPDNGAEPVEMQVHAMRVSGKYTTSLSTDHGEFRYTMPIPKKPSKQATDTASEEKGT